MSVPFSRESASIRSHGVLFSASLAAGSDPAASRAATTEGVVLNRAAACRGVHPFSFRALTSAPAFTSAVTTAGIETVVSNHTFRGTGITAYLEHPDAKLEEAQKMAGHVDPKTTRLYDRRRQTVSLDEVERIGI